MSVRRHSGLRYRMYLASGSPSAGSRRSPDSQPPKEPDEILTGLSSSPVNLGPVPVCIPLAALPAFLSVGAKAQRVAAGGDKRQRKRIVVHGFRFNLGMGNECPQNAGNRPAQVSHEFLRKSGKVHRNRTPVLIDWKTCRSTPRASHQRDSRNDQVGTLQSMAFKR